MIKVEQLIINNKLICEGETIAVACSGGQDSMCLLNILYNLKKRLKFNLVAINIDHNLRPSSASDSEFVKHYCEKMGVKVYSYSINVKKICEKNKVSCEQGARDARYEIFNRLLQNGTVDKIALGHHQNDQAETILLNIFRGTGINGACGMELNRENKYIRPLLYTSKTEIKAYIAQNDIPFVEDETNSQNDYSRNYIRNMILPMIRARWSNADATICEFGKLCSVDNDYINSQVSDQAIIRESGSTVKIFTSYFNDNIAIVSRLILKALKSIGASIDIEKKHIKLIVDMALSGENGARLNLKNGVVAIKEYNFVTFTSSKTKPVLKPIKLARGKFNVPNIGVIEVYNDVPTNLKNFQNAVDALKIPKNAVWRFRQDGDVFEKFKGKQKSLNEFLIDKKVPARFRDSVPVLAVDNEIYVVAGVEISDKVKIDNETKSIYGINFIRF